MITPLLKGHYLKALLIVLSIMLKQMTLLFLSAKQCLICITLLLAFYFFIFAVHTSKYGLFTVVIFEVIREQKSIEKMSHV